MKRYRVRTEPETGKACLPVADRGAALTPDPILNKGTAFLEDERLYPVLGGLRYRAVEAGT